MADTCSTCTAYGPIDDEKGACRANPPVPLIVGVGQNSITKQPFPLMQAISPTVNANNWCRCYQKNVDLSKIDLSSLSKLSMEGSA